MKKIVASVGLLALGASGLHAATVDGGLTAESAKPWSVAATLRGFYDDNINTAPNGPGKQDSFGFEISPSLALSWSVPQTVVSFSYLYSLKYYDTKPAGNAEHYDQINTFNFLLQHAFNERYQVKVQDSFVIGQEPDLLRSGNAFSTFQRVPGDNIRNYGDISLDGQLSPLFGFEVGYANSLYDYADSGHVDSTAGLLNRLEHTIHLDSRWTIQPQTVGVLGYQYKLTDYTANEVIGILDTGEPLVSSDRNSSAQYVYVGADHTFRPDLTGSFRVGARYVDYYNDPSGNNSDWGPYANASMKWLYGPDSYVEGGLSYDINASDVAGINGTSFTTDEESGVIYAAVHHRFTPKIRASALAQFQNSTFRGGSVNNETERYYLVGLNATYDFNHYFSAEIGYNYDDVNSEVPGRSFSRNRVYIGVTAAY